MERRLGVLLAATLLLGSLGAGCLGSGEGGGTDGPSATGQENQDPASFFVFNCHHLECTFDGTRSSDADGAIVSYEWRFGDGGRGQGSIADHTYPQPGTYTVSLTVRDTGGAEDTSRRDVSVQAAPPGHRHGNGGGDGGDQDEQSVPDDYHARHQGPVTPDFAANWTFPVNDSQAALIHVKFNVTSNELPAGVANNVTVNLTDPAGQVVQSGSVDTRSPEVEWNVTRGAGTVGTWTVRAQGNGLGDEDLGGTDYVLVVDVYYGASP